MSLNCLAALIDISPAGILFLAASVLLGPRGTGPGAWDNEPFLFLMQGYFGELCPVVVVVVVVVIVVVLFQGNCEQ